MPKKNPTNQPTIANVIAGLTHTEREDIQHQTTSLYSIEGTTTHALLGCFVYWEQLLMMKNDEEDIPFPPPPYE